LNINLGVYRDDALGVLAMTPRQCELTKKEICKVFKQHKLSITIEVNLKVVNFLDVTLDLNSGLYKPYMKPNNTPIYINRKSNHPPGIIKNIPAAVNRRLNSISADDGVFKEAIQPYQDALDKSGYEHQLKYDPPSNANTRKRNRSRKITWFNPPFSQNVSSNVGAKIPAVN
jgi:Holliday junction resolvase RusA-like endonuclease